MITRTFTATMVGLQPLKVEVEVNAHRGLPAVVIIGLATKTIDEAKERITSAIQNCGIRLKSKRTIVNLAPADIRKTGSSMDLAIAVGLLKTAGIIKTSTDTTLFIGELALDGRLKNVRGLLPIVLAAKKLGFKHVVLPKEGSAALETVKDITLLPIAHLQEYLAAATGQKPLQPLIPKPFSNQLRLNHDQVQLFNSIVSQHQAKRALVIAAAGGHHLLMTGPPGAGKSMIAQTLQCLLPPLTEAEALEVTTIHSLSEPPPTALITLPPFRAPHHTTSKIGLIGGGATLRSGEITLAHRGVLFLDELAEFSRATLEVLRQPLEDRSLTLTRSGQTHRFPCQFILLAATNPCPCGYFGSSKKSCLCSPRQRELYQQKISGPLLDRIDLKITTKEVEINHLLNSTADETTTLNDLVTQVTRARQRQRQRWPGTSLTLNAYLTPSQIKTHCHLTSSAQSLLVTAAEKLALSARSYFKVIKVAQTISDLEGADDRIQKTHIAEALQYR